MCVGAAHYCAVMVYDSIDYHTMCMYVLQRLYEL